MSKRGYAGRSKKRNDDHVVMGDGSVRCLHCGGEQEIAYPCDIRIMGVICKEYAKNHRRCKPSEAGKARFRFKTAAEWHASWDTGVSSRTIFSVFAGYGVSRLGPDVPYDGADFGRCYRLLKAFPEWRAKLHYVSDRHPAWVALVGRWSELEALYESELPTGVCPLTNELLRKLREETPRVKE